MAAPVARTKLEAVNAMLYDVGERSVSTLSGTLRDDAARALATLDDVNRLVQLRGWWFNREIAVIAINGSNKYAIPTTLDHVEQIKGGPTTGTVGTPFLVVRNGVLYDTVNATDTFVGGPEVTLVGHRMIDFEQLPSSVREYVYCVASIRFQSRIFGASSISQELRDQAKSALALIHEEDLDAEDFDMTYSPHFIDLMHNR